MTAALSTLACGDSRAILTVNICADTIDGVESVELLIRRPAGFAASPDINLIEGAYQMPLEGPYQPSARFELVDGLGDETVMALVQLADGCQLVTAEVPLDGALDICQTGREVAPTLALGNLHTCALFADGSVRCFGESEFARLGTAVTDIAAMDPATMCPVPVPPAIDIVAGEEHSCALSENGDVRCWGQNDMGQVGLGRSAEMPIVPASGYLPPVQLSDRAIDLVVGQHNTCAILEGGQRLQCWGENAQGGLGVGNRDPVGDNEPPDTFSPLDMGAPILDVALGDHHTCVLLDLDGGTIRCWGRTQDGESGYADGNIEPIELPPTDRRVEVGQVPVALAANYLHSCAIVTDEVPVDPPVEPPVGPVPGEVVCWGVNADNTDPGFLGYGNTTAYGLDVAPDVPLDLPGLATHIAVGRDFTCALLDNGELRCWGDNGFGRLAALDYDQDIKDTAEFADPNIPAVMAVDVGETVEDLFLGRHHACVLVSSDTGPRARCWGRAQYGQLGNRMTDSIGRSVTPLEGGAVFSL